MAKGGDSKEEELRSLMRCISVGEKGDRLLETPTSAVAISIFHWVTHIDKI